MAPRDPSSDSFDSSPEPESRAPTSPSKKRKNEIDQIEGKPLPVKPTSDDEAEPNDGLEVPAGKGGKAAKGEKKSNRSEWGVWIGNLAFSMTRPELFQWIVDNSGGAIKTENITRNRGFAYVDFDTEAAAMAALSLTETELNGRNVLIKKATNFEGRPEKNAETDAPADGEADGNAAANGAAAKKSAPSRKIYVGNLGFQTTEDDLRHNFDKCGEIDWVKVATFEDTGKCKGYGWVKFKEPEAADWGVKGFVKIKEEIETEDDFKESKGDDEDADGETAEKKFKMRKWWVNRLHGRQLKVEFAEDDQVRYKKRYGKDRPRDQQAPSGKRPETGDEAYAARKAASFPRRQEPTRAPKKVYGDEQVATYLTGGMVKAEGKKTTFD
ncbi:Nucleotide-binding- alpha-beta plait [Apiospora hydei]|uniref:Nucleotide-binding- alpha-beta plait n=1 Tax=Apiospora hydei TaxID=1337664 RepID=A0ABR1VJN8_9PEZI